MKPWRVWWLRSGGCYCHDCGGCTHLARWRFPAKHLMSCQACMGCRNSTETLWTIYYLPGLGKNDTSEYYRLSDWWHFRSWLASLIGMTAYRWIAPKDPVKGTARNASSLPASSDQCEASMRPRDPSSKE